MLTEQSLGGEDFAWYLTKVPGAMARLGTRTPGGRTYDLHQGDFRVDERAIGVGARLLARTAILAGGPDGAPAAPDRPSSVRGAGGVSTFRIHNRTRSGTRR